MSVKLLPQCENLKEQVETILQLWHQDPILQGKQDTTRIQSSLSKAISPTFEIVFAGAFSAGKSMLINALLERELLYSAEGHATGTECYIAYAEPSEERVVLTFLSEHQVREQITAFCTRLNLLSPPAQLENAALKSLKEQTETIIQQEGGKSKSERAKQADALGLLIEGFQQNRASIHPTENKIFSMEQFNFSNLKEAASFARRGANSAVLRKVEYYCHHPLLKDGNVIVDTPGIDAPVKADAERTYQKIADPDTSAVICVLKSAATGELTQEETDLIEHIQANASIRDRVFYVFNRIDETWYNAQLRQRLDSIINQQFRQLRIFKTSGLLGFYGSQLKTTTPEDRFGLDTIFAESIKGLGGEEETPQFVSEFNKYCGSGKLVGSIFRPSIHGYETPLDNYVRILREWGKPLIEHMIKDSGIEEFRLGITRYLTEEKRPQLFSALANDLQPLCIELRKSYLDLYRDLDSKPREVEGMIAHELMLINQELTNIGREFNEHIQIMVNEVIDGTDKEFEADFRKLQSKMVRRLDELLDTFSVDDVYSRAIRSHPRNSTAPLLAVLVEAFYYLSNELEDILVESANTVVESFFRRLNDRVRNSNYYKQLFRLLGSDNDLERKLLLVEEITRNSLINGARKECDRYVRESPRFYDEGTFSIYQFREVLRQTSQSYDISAIRDAEAAIRQLLKLDFEPKINQTVRSNFRQETNNTLKTQLLPIAKQVADEILQRYPEAKQFMEETLKKEAKEKIALNEQRLKELEMNIDRYNQAVSAINLCLQALGLNREMLPMMGSLESSSFKGTIETLVSPPEGEMNQTVDSVPVDLGTESFPELDGILDDLR
ncbi:dynamin family protein [Thermostichus vulcanus]|uniref:Dynamin family protein n=1 Tax=Thermostichus vulcanus str. 'Rupite' TaxID=2813851 RepID=A0ABT0C7P2_THEVL|nr:dynamin family protein [Thermostichus vulcanus]MCJ2541809.1 dynamin family protein [Thermostichus vulcanus str. 'Rupite']